MNGTDLLTGFRETGSEQAFADLVRAYTNLVYSVAQRRLSDSALAQEAAQTVFIRLAKVVPDLRSDAELVAWLHRTTVHVSIDLWRSESRRRAREQHVAAMQPQCTESPAWKEIAPVLDEALNDLEDGERQVILMRYFEQKSMRALGSRFGISEDAAKMRVSRAMEKLRTRLARSGATCTAAALSALLLERSVEAAPAGVALALASVQIPALAGAAAGSGFAGSVGQAVNAKLMAVVAGAILAAGIATILLVSSTGSRHHAGSDSSRDPGAPTADPAALGDPSGSSTNIAADAQSQPDPRKLLQAVASARQRILSGEMEFTAAFYRFDRPFDGTNVVRMKAVFDGNKFRFESFGREYAYTSMEPDAGEMVEAKRKAEGLSREAAEKAGLLKGFESHHVTTCDGAVFLDYWDASNQSPRTDIFDPDKGWGGYIFDPRTLGITTMLSLHVTPDMCLGVGSSNPVQLVGKETVNEIPCWHVQTALDFWIDVAHPARVIKHSNNERVAFSKYDDADPRNPLPLEVRMASFRNGSQRDEQIIVRTSARYNVPVPAASWTLAGLDMKVGTTVMDSRIYRNLGYWTGSGLSENLPPKNPSTNAAPDREALLALLEADPTSQAGYDAAHWIMLNSPDGPDVEKAAEVILRDHIETTNMFALAHELDRMRPACSSNLLEAMINRNPQANVRGNACLTLATLRKDAADYGSNKVATTEAIKLYERVISEFGRVKRSNGAELADLAKPELTDLRQLSIGNPAPDTEGEDLEGQPLKLSDYRGKIVALVVWGHCGGCRPNMLALHDAEKRLAGKPFCIVGVYTDDHPEDAKDLAEKQGFTWPCFKERRDGPIAKAWHLGSWPNTWLLDQNGVIRQRHVYDDSLARAVETMLGSKSEQARD
jgi:RNA polymerase sigma factor (sigma-70 family)